MKRIFASLLAFAFFGGTVSAQNAAELYTQASQLKKDKKITEAKKLLEQVVKVDPTHKLAWYDLGWCQNDLKDYTGALSSLRKARGLGHDYAAMFFELGWAFEKLNLTDSAIANYKQCLVVSPTYSGAYRQLGYIAYDKDQYESALSYFKSYEQNAATVTSDYLYWYRKGFVYNALKDFPNAKTALLKSLAAKTDNLNTYLELGYASSRLKENETAIDYYKKAMTVDPKSHVPYNGIAEVYRDNYKNIDSAMAWYKRTLTIKADERKACFGIGYCLNYNEKYSEAATYLEKAIQQEPTYVAAYVELGFSQYMLGNNSMALTYLQKAIELNPKNENGRYYAGLVYIKQRNKTMAQKMVDELNSLGSKNASLLQEKVNKM